MPVRLLTETRLRNYKPEDEKEKLLCDGDGLFFKAMQSRRNTKNFNATWILRYTNPVTKKATRLGLGKYPEISLAEARALADKTRRKVKFGLEPKQAAITLQAAVDRWLSEKKAGAVTEDTLTDIRRSLEKHVLPKLGNRILEDIKRHEVIEVLGFLAKQGKLETTHRVCQRLAEVGRYFLLLELIERNPFVGLTDAFQQPVVKPLAAIKAEELGTLFRNVEGSNIEIETLALVEFQLHVGARPSECAGARWDEVDLENRLWTVPGSRMKRSGKAANGNAKDHRVPLSSQVHTLLKTLKGITGNSEFIFLNRSDMKKHRNAQTVNTALKRMGYKGKLVAHGFRTIMSTYLNEQGESPDVIEAALAHTDGNKVRAAYNRTDYFEARVAMMQRWSDYLEQKAMEVNAKLFTLNNANRLYR